MVDNVEGLGQMSTYYLAGSFYVNDGYTDIPAGAVLVPNDHPSLNFGWITPGKELGTGSDGLPILVDVEPTPAPQRRITACQVIDTAAGTARARYATDTPFIEPEYELSYTEAVAYINAGYTGQCPDTVKSHAEAYNVTNKTAADEIKAMGDTWHNVLRAVRKIRLAGKQAVETATDDADFMALAQPYIDQLEALQPEASP